MASVTVPEIICPASCAKAEVEKKRSDNNKPKQRPLPPLGTYSKILNLRLPAVGREPECKRAVSFLYSLFIIIHY
jgi:hypothetical protein